MKMTDKDSYLEGLGLKNLGAKNAIVAYLKIIIMFPIILIWNIFKFLINPKKSVVRNFKKILVFPLLEFFTGKSTSEQILKDYTYFHQAILEKEVFDGENIKLNFEVHRSILLNSKIATLISIFVLLFVYMFVFALLDELQLLFLALAFVTAGLTSVISFLIIALKIFLVIALFAVEVNMIKALFVTSKEEIKDYLDETILYADIKSEEIFGKEHSEKVKSTLYSAYLTEKEEVHILESVGLVEKYIFEKIKQLQKTKKSEDKKVENSNSK